MSREDALLALERHATSKIADLSDLRTLRTLGFRGEALPSIAAVSRMVIETRDSEELQGTRVRVESGRVRDVSSTGRDRGTTVAVHGLFFNVPARRKFLKGVETEFKHVSDALTGLALAYPSVAFVLSHNGREILNLARSERQRRLEAVFGVRFGRDAVFLDGERHGVRVWGFAGRPELARKSGAQQATVVNGRWVRDRGVTFAVHDGFGGLLVKGFHPAFALLLDLDPSRLDVNVHPAKREVRFADEAKVYSAVAEVVRAGLREEDLVPEVADGIASPAIPAGASAQATPDLAGGIADAPVEQEAYLSEAPGPGRRADGAFTDREEDGRRAPGTSRRRRGYRPGGRRNGRSGTRLAGTRQICPRAYQERPDFCGSTPGTSADDLRTDAESFRIQRRIGSATSVSRHA